MRERCIQSADAALGTLLGQDDGVQPLDPEDLASYDEHLAKITVGSPLRLYAKIELRDWDPAWAGQYEDEAARVRAALGRRAVRIEHVGSTSVEGLPAKPIIDIALEVPAASDEPAYLPDLAAAGYAIRIREPGWFEHRMFKGSGDSVNLHVFSVGCPETERMIRFRDRLRVNAGDRDLYARTKRELALRDWTFVQQYADAKTAVIRAISERS